MTLKHVIAGMAVSLALGLGLGRYSMPAKVVTKTQIKTVTLRQDHTIVVRKPDGTVEVHRDIVTGVHQDALQSKETTRDMPRWQLGIMAGVKPFKTETPAYGASLDYRLLGPVNAGIWGLTNGMVGARVSLAF